MEVFLIIFVHYHVRLSLFSTEREMQLIKYWVISIVFEVGFSLLKSDMHVYVRIVTSAKGCNQLLTPTFPQRYLVHLLGF